MRRIAIVAALLLGLAAAGPANAILPGNKTFTVFTQVRGHGYFGSIDITKRVDNSWAKLSVDITGMHPHQLATVVARVGSCRTGGVGIVRVRWIGAFRGGHWKATFKMTRRMLAQVEQGAPHQRRPLHVLAGGPHAVR